MSESRFGMNRVAHSMTMYRVKEIYYTLQGEGFHSGRPAVFLRFSGCNLWSGHEEDRAKAICDFCDTDFVGTNGPGGREFASATELADTVLMVWKAQATSRVTSRFVVCTGGEPLLQLDQALVESLHERQFEIAIETNGTRFPPDGIDWVCVSPKAAANLVIDSGDELKLVFPHAGHEPSLFERLQFDHFYLQPMDGPQRDENTQLAVQYCLQHPQWRLSLQTHKVLGIP